MSMDKPVLSIVIVTWNSESLITQCLDALPKATSRKFECFVVDSASADNTVIRVSQEAPWVNLHQFTENIGFVRANNWALQKCRSEFIVLLNPDTVPLPGSFDALIAALSRHPEAGIAGPKLLNSDGTLQFSTFADPSITSIAWEYFLRDLRYPDTPHSGRYAREAYELERPVDAVIGACLMIRREALDAIGLLDERYLMYCEEQDWCVRARRLGWEVWYTPTAQVIHYGGRSSQLATQRTFLELQRSRFKLYSKWLPRSKRVTLEFITRIGLLYQAVFWWKQGMRRHLTTAQWKVRLRMAVAAMCLRPSGLPW